MNRLIKNPGLWLLLLAVGLVCAGCSTTDAENASAKPWNSPEGWQGGVMGGYMNQQHR